MIGLALASLATWAIWLAKALELRSARSDVQKDLRVLANCSTLTEAHERLRKGTSSVAQLMLAAADEIRASIKLRADGLKERIAWQLERMEVTASRKIARGTGVLATIGSTAPFVGLFGTVWGIMDSFIGISRAHTTNLAVVAPGIAEALLATALGLVAAIPAVVIYNLLARLTARYRALLGDASVQVITLLAATSNGPKSQCRKPPNRHLDLHARRWWRNVHDTKIGLSGLRCPLRCCFLGVCARPWNAKPNAAAASCQSGFSKNAG